MPLSTPDDRRQVSHARPVPLDAADVRGHPNRHRPGRVAALAVAAAAVAFAGAGVTHGRAARAAVLRSASAQAGTVLGFHPATVVGEAFLPVLDGLADGTVCDVRIHVQNVSGDVSKVALVVWGSPGACGNECEGALKVECSGLMKPGSTWTMSGPQVPTGARSGALFSFSGRMLSQLDIDLGFDDITADYACELLFFGIVGDCGDTRRFMRAYSLGQTYQGLPLDRAAGGPIAAWVARDCPANGRPPTERPTYTALSGVDIGGYYQDGGTYRYIVPADPRLVPGDAVPRGAIHIQNAGPSCASVQLLTSAECGRDGLCQAFTLAPGERRTIDARMCDAAMGGTVEADQPLAIILDSGAISPTLSLPAASEQRLSYATGEVEMRQAGAMELNAPLVFGGYQGWNSGFVVQNLSRETEADVKVFVLDRSGDIVTTLQFDRLCPFGARYISLDELRLTNFLGSVRIVSQVWWLPSATVTDPPRLMAWAVARSGIQPDDAIAYPLLGGGEELSERPAIEQVGLLSLPSIVRTDVDGTLSSRWVVLNRAQSPGVTDIGLYIYDQNGLLDVICQRLDAKEADYIDLQTWGYINSGFKGSAIVSAVAWSHGVFDARGNEIGKFVSLSAVTAALPGRKPGPGTSGPIAGIEPSWAAIGIPFTLAISAHFVAPFPLCPGVENPPRPRLPTPPRIEWTPGPPDTAPTTAPPSATSRSTTPPSPTVTAATDLASRIYLPYAFTPRTGPSPTPSSVPAPVAGPDAEGEGGPYLPPGRAVYIPVLDVLGASAPGPVTACRGQIHVMNVDADPTVALLVVWDDALPCDEACAGPSRVVCSGLIKPGTRWTFTPESGRSAAVFSVRAGKLADVGVADPTDRTIAAALCDGLTSAFRTCQRGDAYAAFQRAFAAGGEIDGVPLDQARGGPLAVEVHRRCEGVVEGAAGMSASYGGVAANETGAPEGAANAYRYVLPLIYGNAAGFDSLIYVQNAADGCADVEWEYKARDDCVRTLDCGAHRIAPGGMVALDAAGCTGDDFQGSIFLSSSRPLAIAVDIVGRGNLGTYVGEPLRVQQTTGDVPQTAGSRTLFAPLIYSEYQGWDTGIQVENMSSTTAAKVKVYLLDRSGDIITTLIDWVCPLGVQTYALPVIFSLPGHWVGSARVESQDWDNSPPSSDHPVNINAVATLMRYSDVDRADMTAFASYNLLTEAEAYDWRLGHGAGGSESGVALVALPFVAAPAGAGTRTELAVTNLVPQPGFTRFAVVLFDANGRVDDVCLDVHERAVEYLDLARFAHLTHGFAGSALVSATSWTHDVLDENDAYVRSLVGLAATAVTRDDAALDHDVPGDELSISTGVPLRGEPARRLAPLLAGVGCTVDVEGRAPAVREFASGAQAGELFVPALRAGPSARPCDATITVQNLGRGGIATDGGEAKAILIAFGAATCPAACAPIVGVVCGGLMKPGGSWTFSTTTLPATAIAGTIFSLTPAAADQLCPLLGAAVGGDCARGGAFVDAYRAGGTYDGVALAGAIGPALAAEVLRTCPALSDANVPTTDSAPAMRRFDALAGSRQADGPASSTYQYGLPQIGDATGQARTMVYATNAGDRCATVTLRFHGVRECPSRPCASATISPGGTVRLDTEACRAGGRLLGAGVLESDQPLAAVVDTASATSLTSYAAAPLADGSTVAFAPLMYSEMQGWNAAIHIQNVDPTRPGRVKAVFLDRSGDVVETLTDWLCPGGAAVLRLDAVYELDGNWVGDVRVESLDVPMADGSRASPVPVQAVAEITSVPQPSGANAATQAIAYRFLSTGFDHDERLWPSGTRNGRLIDGGTLLALPNVANGTKDAPGGSVIAIANLVPEAGFTGMAFYIFDANGLVDYVCQKLYAQEVEYIDIATWGYIEPGFRGSAVLSAMFWRHPLRDAAGHEVRNVVGLGAVLVQRASGAAGAAAKGDRLAASAVWPLGADARLGLALPDPQCPDFVSVAPPPPTATPALHQRAPAP
ncbi:MAG: hypothetical protein ABI780_03250 [Ardenticatenales bacterium]